MWKEKKKELLQQVETLKQSRNKAQRLLDAGHENLQQLNKRLLDQSLTKDNLERWSQLSRRQWHIQLEVQFESS